MSKLLLIFKINDINFINISFNIAKFHLQMARPKKLMMTRNCNKFSESNRKTNLIIDIILLIPRASSFVQCFYKNNIEVDQF